MPEPAGASAQESAHGGADYTDIATLTLTDLALPTQPAAPRGRHARPTLDVADLLASSTPPSRRSAAVEAATAGPVDPRLAGVDIAAMLAELAKDEDPLVGEFNRRFATKGQRTVAITVGWLLVTGAAIAAMFVLGSILH